MGCCSSTSRERDEQAPYPSQPRATSTTAINASGETPRGSTTSRSPTPTNRRHLLPAERFNRPLRQHKWKSKYMWTAKALQREREEFFDTRVSGSEEMWNCLHAVTDLIRAGDFETAQGIIDAADLTVPTGDIVDGVYDQAGRYYQIPEYIAADPSNLREDEPVNLQKVDEGSQDTQKTADIAEGRKEEKGKKKAPKKGEGVKVKARLSDRAQDVTVWIDKDEKVQGLIERIKEEVEVSSKIRIAYLGKLLRETQPLVDQGYKEGHVVNALVF